MTQPTTSPLKVGIKAGIRFCLLLMAVWATFAIFYSNLPPTFRPLLAGVCAAASLIALVGRRSTYKTRLGFLAAFSLVLVLWLLILPSNDRNWQPDLTILPWAEISGDKVTLHNIRNCDYRSETDFTVRHYDRTYDLSKLKHIDFFLVYWGSPNIAHTILSFVFEGEGNVAISIETRKEKGEEYSTVKGFFRQYELTYVVADERDVVRLRTNYRKEDVYLYRLNTPPEVARGVFLNYLTEINRLRETPEWYNALTANCTTSIRQHTLPYNPDARFDWRLLVNGHIDEMLYEQKVIDIILPFDELKKRSYINPAAQAADKDPAFSQHIRVNLPQREVQH